jgi:AbrB family looped-hinge helix DNA binding protein
MRGSQSSQFEEGNGLSWVPYEIYTLVRREWQMVKSKITSKYQTTVPKTVRERLGLGPSDSLQWEVVDGAARVSAASHGFLERRGTVHVGRGSAIDDIRRARRTRGGSSG